MKTVQRQLCLKSARRGCHLVTDQVPPFLHRPLSALHRLAASFCLVRFLLSGCMQVLGGISQDLSQFQAGLCHIFSASALPLPPALRLRATAAAWRDIAAASLKHAGMKHAGWLFWRWGFNPIECAAPAVQHTSASLTINENCVSATLRPAKQIRSRDLCR